MDKIHSTFMTKLITLTATFECKAALVAQSPMTAKQTYLDGSPLNKKDTAKADRIAAYYVSHGISPVFVSVEPIKDDNAPLTAEAWIDLGLWSKDGLPMFQPKSMDGEPQYLPMTKRGKGKGLEKPSKKAYKRVSPPEPISTLFT